MQQKSVRFVLDDEPAVPAPEKMPKRTKQPRTNILFDPRLLI